VRGADGRADQHQPAHRSVAERDVLLATKLHIPVSGPAFSPARGFLSG
jgi:hypothetical protein